MPRTFLDLNLLANMVAKLGNIVGEHVKVDIFAYNVGQFGHTLTVCIVFCICPSSLVYAFPNREILDQSERRSLQLLLLIGYCDCCHSVRNAYGFNGKVILLWKAALADSKQVYSTEYSK